MAVLLLERLRLLARRMAWVHVAAGLGWGVVTAILLLLFAVWLDLLWDLAPALRTAADILGVAALTLLAPLAGWLALQRGRPALLALRLDDVAQARGQIRAAVDLALAEKPISRLSAGLATMAIEQANRLSLEVAPKQVVRLRPVGNAWATGCALALVVGAVGWGMPRLVEAEWLRFSDPFGDHPPYSRLVYHVHPGDVTVGYGDSVEVRVTTEGALADRLELVLLSDGAAAPETLPMFASASGEWCTTIASVTAPGRYHVRAHAGRSNRFRIELTTVPRLEEVTFRITPPAYTNRPATEGPLPQGGIAGLPGTRVEVRVRSNRPLSGGSLQAAGSTLSMTPSVQASHEVTGSFEVRKAGKLTLSITDIAGQASRDTFTAPVAVVTDERPGIRIAEPPALSFATPSVGLPVLLAAEDDYGLTRVQLFRSLNDSRALPLDWTLPTPAPLRWSTTAILPLSEYGVAPGDEIKLFARAEDNDPQGPNGAESAVTVVRIISQEEYEKLVRAREGIEVLLSKYRQAQRRTEALAAEVERLRQKKRSGDKAAEESAADLEKLSARMRDEAEAIRQAARRELPYDVDKALRKHLEQTARRLDTLAEAAQRLARSRPSEEELDKMLEQMLKELQEQQEQLEREALLPLEHLALILPLLEDAARFAELYQRQEGLAQRLASLKGRDQPPEPAIRSRLRDLKVEQEQLRAALTRLLEDIEDHAAALPDDPKLQELRQEALDFVKAVQESGGGEAMGKAERGLGELSGSRGHAGAREAADILSRFVARLQGEGGMAKRAGLCLHFQPVLSQCLGATIEQLLGDMGLGALGEGSGNGYSAQRNSLENLGLYGNLPSADSGQDDRSTASSRAGAGRTRTQRGVAPGQAIGAAGSTTTDAQSAAEASVPLSYRRRVAEYFQRIADETGR